MTAEFLHVFLIAMSPVVELRGAIPFAMGAYGFSPFLAFALAVAGNVLPPLLLIPFLGRASSWLSLRSAFFERFFAWLFERTRTRHEKRFEMFKSFALVTLVAVPLPFTGAWTASLAAFVFAIPLRKAFPLIVLGVIIAGIIVTLATLGIISVL